MTSVDSRFQAASSESVSPMSRAVPVAVAALALLPFLGSVMFGMSDQSSPPLDVTRTRPALIFSEYLIDYGEEPIQPQPVLSAEFPFRNGGRQAVQVEQLIPSCGCVKPQMSRTTIPPGESGKLVLPIVTATEQPGFHSYLVRVRYADPEPREAQLEVKVVLPERSVLVEPRALFLMGQFSADEEHVVTVTDLRETALNVESVTSSHPGMTAHIVSRVRDETGSRTTVGIRVADGLSAGSQRGLVEVRTGDPEYPLLQIPVLARSRERSGADSVVVTPEEVRLIASPGPQHAGRLSLAFPEKWGKFRIETCPTQLTAHFEEDHPAGTDLRRLQLQLSFTQMPTVGTQHGVVTLVADEGRETITVPVRVIWPVVSSN